MIEVAGPAIQSELEEILAEPFDAVCERERTELESMLRDCRKRVVLFGAGSAGTRAAACLRSIGVEPLAFADNRAAAKGATVDGIPVLSPQRAAAEFEGALFFVTIWNAQHRFAQTQAQLAGLGVAAVEPMSALQWRFPAQFLPFFSLDLPHKLYRERAAVIRTAALWSDDRSRDEYTAHVRWRALGDFAALPPPSTERQYFPGFFALDPRESFVDCGAFDGDTLREFLERSGGAFEHVVALEPSPDTYAQLVRGIAALPPGVRNRIEAQRYAAGDRCETVRFAAGGGRDARVSRDGSVAVEARTLDTLCAARNVTYIKMDIEGAEGAALAGAAATIRRDRPILAICVYHRHGDLWRLPALVSGLVPEYRWYLRSHECDGWETVAYAVPPERALGDLGVEAA